MLNLNTMVSAVSIQKRVKFFQTTVGTSLIWIGVTLVTMGPMLWVQVGVDEGLFALEALKLLEGKLPNLDFYCAYFGFHIFYNAFWFWVLGPSLLSLRIGWLVLLIIFSPVVYRVSRRHLDRLWSSLTTLLVLSLTAPIFHQLSANWYAWYFSFFTVVLALKGFQSPDYRTFRMRSFFTGLLLGLTVLTKHTVGLYTGFSLFILALLEPIFCCSPYKNNAPSHQHDLQINPSTRLGKALTISGLFGMVAYLGLITQNHSSPHTFLIVWLPSLIMIGNVGQYLYKKRNHYDFSSIPTIIMPTLLGFCTCFALFFIPYLWRVGFSGIFGLNLFQYSATYLDVFFKPYTLDSLATNIIGLFLAGLIFVNKNRFISFICLFIGCYILSITIFQSYINWFHGSFAILAQLPFWSMLGGASLFIAELNKRTLFSQTPTLRPPKTWVYIVFFVYGTWMYLNTYPFFFISYVAFSIGPLLFLLMQMASDYYMKESKGSKGLTLARTLVILLTSYWIIFGFSHGYRLTETLPEYGRLISPYEKYQHYLSHPRGGLWVDTPYRRKISHTLEFIKKHSTRQDDLYLLTDGAEIYFLSNHTIPSPYMAHAFIFQTDGQDIIQQLEAHRVQYLLIEGDNTVPQEVQKKLGPYIQATFKLKEKTPYYTALERKSS